MPIDGLGEKRPLCMSLPLPGGEVSISISLEGISNDLKVELMLIKCSDYLQYYTKEGNLQD